MKITDTPSIERLKELLAKATRVRDEIRYRDKGDGEERYELIGDPCGFPVAVFGDHNDALFDLAARKVIAALETLTPSAGEVERPALRPEVLAFATMMERELRANDHKPGWKDDAAGPLVERVFEEAREMQAAVLAYPRETDAYRHKVGSEAADVANMAMMVADVCGALASLPPQPDIEGRARELLATEYDLDVAEHEAKGYKNAANYLRQRAADIRKGVAELHTLRAIVKALSLPTTEIRREAGWCFDMKSAPANCIVFDQRWGVTEGMRFDRGNWGAACFNGSVIGIRPVAWRPKPEAPALAKEDGRP